MSTHIFYKYRHKFAYGKDNWEYGDAVINSWEDWVDERTEELEKIYDYSEHYRGVDIIQIVRPPETWLKEQIRRSSELAEGYLNRERELKRILNEIPNATHVDSERLSNGTKVRTLRPLHDNEFTQEALAKRSWGKMGKVVGYHDSHGLCYEVRHGFTVGVYDPDEIEVVG